MLDCYSTNATVAKIRSIHGNMFTRENYHDLIARRSVPEAAEYLARSKRFKEAFREVDPNTVHRGFLEELLYKENFNTYVRLCKFQGLDKMPFYDFMIRRREIESILSLINNMNSGLHNSYLNNLPGYVIKHSKINLLEMSKAEKYEDLLKLLRGTHYYKVLVKIPVLEDGNADYTECELRLRSEFFENLLEVVRKDFLSGEAKELEDIIAREITALNLINAYRMKAFFGYSGDEIKKRSIKVSGVGSKKLEKYYELESADTMLEWITKSQYGINDDTEYIETKINSAKYVSLSHVIARSVSAPVVLYAFMQLCNIEVSNIVHIIEGIRYNVDPSVIESQLIV